MSVFYNKIIFNKFTKFLSCAKCYSNYTVRDILKNRPSDRIFIKGWIRSLRKMKDKVFLDVTDGSCNEKLQIVIPKSMTKQHLNSGASIEVQGGLIENNNQQIELHASCVSVVGDCDVTDNYPFRSKQTYQPDYARQYLHFRPKLGSFASLLRVRHTATLAIHNYYNSLDYVSVNTPILTSNDCEGAGETFCATPDSIDLLKSMSKSLNNPEEIFFDRKTYLSVSGQMHLEAAAHALTKVYTLGPTFRAENSKSRLHLSEFYMLEAEIAFLNDLKCLLGYVEQLVKNITLIILQKNSDDVFSLIGDETKRHFQWLEKDFSILEYNEAVAILTENSNQFKKQFDEKLGLTKEHEHFLVKFNENTPTFVINWPKNLKPFYMKTNSDGEKVAAFDLLVPNVGELVGGSLREDDYDILKTNLPKTSANSLDWYLDLRKFGGVPTGGYGMGFERFLQFLLNITNIKDTIPFPRWPHNCSM